MKRILTLASIAVSALTLANCKSTPPQEVHVHHYSTNTRYVTTKPAGVTTTYKSAGVSSNSPEGFEAVSPPASYSRD